MSDEVLLHEADGILTITINRPAAKNAVNLAVATGIAAAIDRLDASPALRVGILTGAGSAFCSGMDLKAFLTGEMPMLPGRGFGGLVEAPPQKPLIAAIEGYALAGGLELMLACDLAVAGDNARFGIPEAKRGLVAAAGGLVRLPRMVPYRFALELALTGEMIPASRAYELGLLNRIVPAGEALEGALALARSIVANGPLAVATSKRVMRDSAGWSDAEIWPKQNAATAAIFDSEDAREGAAAFAEKRAPVWKGR
ncbi:MAG: crotonase/enoyl-CoA hydratase family protein [Gammaproteobacteria bacterium]|nr:crotonase/enoyl-CoA hydratase family protein [Gammaproteobacteria bacterium]MBK9467449.1 crotonase/enoyl-CoA hydratase family protein [Gammaproteobacteria bacterium]MBP6482094.1 crotonase/enoyl-CoA hydratase family protein [Pseudomonadales bacterium]MBP7911553.1 crotonase/enoyl-CoA hydratase family protein [Pseudomonadales bacterium]